MSRFNKVKKEIIFSIFLWLIAIKLTECDICELCNCSQQADHNCKSSSNVHCVTKIVFVCDGISQKSKNLNQSIQLDSIEWPKGRNISASFNHLNLHFLIKPFCNISSAVVTEINLDNNLIDGVTNDPFKFCTSLTTISISNNFLHRLPQDFLKSAIHIEKLNLSHNALAEFRDEILLNHQHLIELDLSHNKITTLKLNEIVHRSSNIEIINAAFNELFLISGDSGISDCALKQLNLAHNKLTVLTSTSFTAFPNLTHIYLSSNELLNIEDDTFARLHTLLYLDLSKNKLKDINLNLTNSVERLNLAGNSLKYWPMKNIPTNLSIIEIQSNNLFELVDNIELPNVKLLNISHNRIEAIPRHLNCPNLTILDMSFNRFTQFPKELGHQLPILDWLRMNGNPMEEIQMTGKVIARKLEFSEMPLLRELNASQFNVLDSKNGCIEITVSHCPLLKSIHNSFAQTIDLCALDLSHNALNRIDEDLASWSFLTQGVDLQMNPFQCTCQNAQWMLEILLPLLYNEKRHQHYLENLRCGAPASFAQHRLLRYFKHERAFCDEEPPVQRGYFELLAPSEDDSNQLRIDRGLGLVITICMISIISMTSVFIMIILVRRNRTQKLKKNNRRFDSGGFF